MFKIDPTLMPALIGYCEKIALAILALIIGRIVIGLILRAVSASSVYKKADPTVARFVLSFLRIGLIAVLLISVIGILGVPMASVIAVLASAGLAVGLALQGALTNLAGGIMLLCLRPFKIGDYVQTAGAEGTVQEVTLFYTTFITVDNRRITVPNSAIMGASIVNFSSEDLRRVDLSFSCAKSEDHEKVQAILLDACRQTGKVLSDPAPFARLCGGTFESMDFTVRAWTKSADYWDVFFDLNERCTKALGAAGVKAPAKRVLSE